MEMQMMKGFTLLVLAAAGCTSDAPAPQAFADIPGLVVREADAAPATGDFTPPETPLDTRPASRGCNPNYDPCVPIASDVDCAGGRGNGPAYVSGPVQVVGTDVYGLDRDRDGVGCDR
jgi:hypothetical protein